ncbi:MAG TPA: MarR family transcriptional regulator [Desulfotomaculum sp.]|nr:MarR family transcriptional regulator [Desulfotomaculum sp.]
MDYNDLYQFMLDNIQKIVMPEELIKIELSVSRFELAALMLAERHDNITMSALAQGMSVPMSTATGVVDRLVRKKLLKRDRSEEDRRIVTVALTEEGSELLEKVKKHLRLFFDRVKSLLTEEEFETGINLIRKIALGLRQDQTVSGDRPVLSRRAIKIE